MWALFRNDAGSCRLWALPQGPMLSSPLGGKQAASGQACPHEPSKPLWACTCAGGREWLTDFPWDPQEGAGPGGHRSSAVPSQNSPRLLGGADAGHSLHPEPA